MKTRGVAALLMVLAMSLVGSAPASAHYMSTSEAKLAVLDTLRDKFEYGVARTSWSCRPRKSPHYVLCGLAVRDLDGDIWCGYGEARLRASGTIGSTYNISMRRC